MPRLTRQLPSYRRHRKSGQAVVTIDGKDHYLGPYGSEESKQKYDELIERYLASKRMAPAAPFNTPGTDGLTVNHLIVQYWPHVKSYYRKNGRPTNEVELNRLALRPLGELYGRTKAEQFSPRCLCIVRQKMIDDGLSRTVINQHVGRIRRMFKWAVKQELVSPSVYHGLQAVDGLKRGRTEARENEPVEPVPEHMVEAVLPLVSSPVRAMIRLQLLTGMRPGEVTAMRGRDLDTSDTVWVYEYREHKTKHHGRRRKIFLGPQAQEMIQPFLKTELDAPLFSPADAEAERRAQQHRRRRTYMSCGNKPGSNRKKKPAKQPREAYDVNSYRRAIQYACDKAFPPPEELQRIQVEAKKGYRWEKDHELQQRLSEEAWQRRCEHLKAHRWSPNRLRHNAGTYLRKHYGIDVARAVLGHSSPVVTEVYAELDFAKAAEVIGEVG